VKDIKKVAPAAEATEAKNRITSVVSARLGEMSRGKSTRVPAWIIAKQRRDIAARDPGTDRLIGAMGIAEDRRKRRSGRMWIIATKIKDLFLKEGVTIRPIKGRLYSDTVFIELSFRCGEYIDEILKRREHRWKITIESEDFKSEGDCPECDGELQTEILEDGSHKIGCDDCGYVHKGLGMEVTP